MDDPSFDAARAALLSMDMQNAMVASYAGGDPGLLDRAAATIARARRAGIPVVHVRVGFRPGMPEASERNAVLGPYKRSPELRERFAGPALEIHPAVAPEGDEVVVTKRRVNAFVGTDLELVLRAAEVDTLVLQGITTSGVVLATALHAADADYRIVIVRDCCVDADPEVHACLLDKVLARRTTLVTADRFAETLGA